MTDLVEIFDKLRNTSAIFDKIRFIRHYARKNPLLLDALKYGIDPQFVYGITCDENGIGSGKITPELFNILAKLREGYEPHKTMELSFYVRGLDASNAELACDIINKKLRIGASAITVNKAIPDLISTFEVMLAHPIDFDRVVYPCYATYKIEGQRCIYDKGKFYTRRGKLYQGLDALAEQLKGFPKLDCEIIVPGTHFYSGSGKLRSHDRIDDAVIYILDAPTMPSTSFIKRIEAAMYSPPSKTIQIVPWEVCKSADEVHQTFRRARHLGYEGLVVRPSAYPYVGKRSYDWMKYKAQNTVDATIIDMEEGEGRLKGKMGAILVKYYIVDSAYTSYVGSGFSDDQRADMWSRRASFIGKTAEIIFHEYTPYGALREPRFAGIREDK